MFVLCPPLMWATNNGKGSAFYSYHFKRMWTVRRGDKVDKSWLFKKHCCSILALFKNKLLFFLLQISYSLVLVETFKNLDYYPILQNFKKLLKFFQKNLLILISKSSMFLLFAIWQCPLISFEAEAKSQPFCFRFFSE